MSDPYFRPVDFNNCERKAICPCGTENEKTIYNVEDTCLGGFDFDSADCKCVAPECFYVVGRVTLSPIEGCGAANGVFDDFTWDHRIGWWMGAFKDVPTLPTPDFGYYHERCRNWQSRGVLWSGMEWAELCDGTKPEGGLAELGNTQAVNNCCRNPSRAELFIEPVIYNEQTGAWESQEKTQVGCWLPGPLGPSSSVWTQKPQGTLPCQ